MTRDNTDRLFEYFVHKMVEWYKEAQGDLPDPNDFSKMKMIKLHFFVCTLDKDLFEKDTFFAMQFGPVCGVFLDAINQNRLGKYTIDSNGIHIDNTNSHNEDFVAPEFKKLTEKYDKAINKLKEINKDLIAIGAWKLSEIAHTWSCWKRAWNKAKNNGCNAHEMDFADIENAFVKNYA